jgi:hypothetical protein
MAEEHRLWTLTRVSARVDARRDAPAADAQPPGTPHTAGPPCPRRRTLRCPSGEFIRSRRRASDWCPPRRPAADAQVPGTPHTAQAAVSAQADFALSQRRIHSLPRAGFGLVPAETRRLRTRRCQGRRIRLGCRVRAGGLCVVPAANSFAPAGGLRTGACQIAPGCGRAGAADAAHRRAAVSAQAARRRTLRCPSGEFIRSRGRTARYRIRCATAILRSRRRTACYPKRCATAVLRPCRRTAGHRMRYATGLIRSCGGTARYARPGTLSAARVQPRLRMRRI